ncbi:2Fe-2S iron-sulfur cluster-binding protein [Streptomyces sp. NPDC059398]|uniref:2Fe-2S iron-sulfur cluster-binding protein n=1 Tax=Streptomyces sp. NPDC059398 TaxID=3346820 RepID=UPI003689D07A
MTTNDDRGGWQPVPQGGEYDAEATAFVQLPEGMDPSGAPLAAPGHGYVPPMILPLTPAAGTDPAATGQWTVPQAQDQGRPTDQGHQPQQAYPPHQFGQSYQPYESGPPHQSGQPRSVPETPYWPEPARDPQPGPGYPQEPVATGQWTFGDAQDQSGRQQPYQQHQQQHQPHSHEQHPQPHQQHGGDLTGQWTIPVAEGDVPEESGEYTASSLMRPATLPGGAPAPWAVPAEPAPDHGTPAGGTPVPHDPQDAQQAGAEPSAGDAPVAAADEPGSPRGGYGSGQDDEGAGAADRVAGHDGGHEPHRPHEPHGAPAPDPQDIPAPRAAESGVESPEPDAVSASGAGADDGPETTAPAPADPEATHADALHPEAAHPDATHPDAPAAVPGAAVPGAADRDMAEPGTADPNTADPNTADPGPAPVSDAPPAAWSEHTPASYVLRVNGTDRPVTDAWIGESLLYVLRERLGLAGAKDGCSQGECGACNVQVDGRLVASCLVPAATAAGSEVRTVEGLAVNGEPSDVQRALADCGAVQCGFCIPGMAMTVHDLLEGNHAPTELETRQALCGNLCRCSGYRGVLDAVGEVVAGRAAAGAVSEEPRIPHQAAPGSGGMQPDNPQPDNPQQHDGGMA